MKRKLCGLLFLAGALFVGCQQDEVFDNSGECDQQMKRVVLAADMGEENKTRASLDSQTGAFSWQSGDLLSVLATDGKFYDFILKGNVEGKTAEFEGEIPTTAQVTTLATYPRIASNGANNTLYSDGILNYVLPDSWTYAKDVTNVPMVASFEEGASHMAFKQVGGVLRFPVKNLPKEATFVLTINNKCITGQFPVDITQLGESCMTAGSSTSSVAISYVSEMDGAAAEFNVPVPVGVYNDFVVTIKDAEGATLFTKVYQKDETKSDLEVKRSSLIVMKDIVLPERPMVISDVWPFFVDARVVFAKYEGITQYAFYIDNADTPIIKEAQEVYTGQIGALVGGEFTHNSTHRVSVAKVVNGEPIEASKSVAVEFTTASVYPLTTNTGTKFVTVGWDDVAVANGTKYRDGKWNLVPKLSDRNGEKGHQRRGYQVQLLDVNGNVIYDLVPFDGHSSFTNVFSDSSWLGKIDGTNVCIPTALAFGYLESNTDYYFRVKTLDEPVIFDSTNGNYNPDGVDQPYPYVLYSERGGCGWSDLVKLTTEAPHVAASENEILFEGFEDIMVANNYMDWAAGVVPDLETTKRQSWDEYTIDTKDAYPVFLSTPANERKWTTQAFSKVVRALDLGIHNPDYAEKTDLVFNEYAGSLQGWTWWSKKNSYGVFPIFGAMRIGQSNGTGNNAALLKTPKLSSTKLLNDIGTKCNITFKMSFSSGAIKPTEIPHVIWVQLFRGGLGDSYISELQVDYQTLHPEDYQSYVLDSHRDKDNYAHHQQYFDCSCSMYLRNGDQVGFLKATGSSNKGTLVIDDIKIEVCPGEYEQNTVKDDGLATEADDTDYDVFGLQEFPISFWWTIPTAAHNYDPAKTYALYKDIADCGFNIVNYVGEVDCSAAENKRIMDICTQLNMKFIGQVLTDQNNPHGFATNAARLASIKQNLASSSTYVGEYIVDEPTALEFDTWGKLVADYRKEFPDKEAYINLFPAYSSRLATASYEQYIREYFDKIPSMSLSYDYYGLGQNPGHYSQSFHNNLDIVRALTLEKRMPFWVITQAGQVGNNRQPSEKEQRWSVWSNIAGGSKGIAYFCYWTPEGFEYYMINREGVKTENYEYIKSINADIKTIGKKLLPCHADGLISTVAEFYPLYINGGMGRTKYGPINSFTTNSHGAMCGCFHEARRSESGENYKGYKALITGALPNNDINVNLALDASVTNVTITCNNTSKPIELFSGLANIQVDKVTISYVNGVMTLDVPEGEAALVEF